MFVSEIRQKICLSDPFKVKGTSKTLKDDIFIPIKTASPHIVFILETGNFVTKKRSYSYVMYDINSGDVLVSFSAKYSNLEKYKNLTAEFPPLTAVSYPRKISDGNELVDIRRQIQELSPKFDALVRTYVKNGELTDNEKETYIEYMNEMKRLKPPSLEPIYDYFANKY